MRGKRKKPGGGSDGVDKGGGSKDVLTDKATSSTCFSCTKKFVDVDALKHHQESKLGKTSSVLIKFTDLPLKPEDENTLNGHIVLCPHPQCCESFDTLGSYFTHLKMKTEHKVINPLNYAMTIPVPFEESNVTTCPHCSQSFASMTTMKNHTCSGLRFWR